MKRIVFSFILLFSCICVFPQLVISQDELEYYMDRDTLSWTQKAYELSLEYALNEEGELKLMEVYEFEGQTKSELYHKVLEWILSVSADLDSAVQIVDEEKGVIVTDCCLLIMDSNRIVGRKSYSASVKPLLQFDFKDGKVRFIYTLQSYDIFEAKQRSGHVLFMGANSENQLMASLLDKKSYLFKNSYPFVNDNSNGRKTLLLNGGAKSNLAALSSSSRITSCLYVNSIAFYRFIKDKIANVLSKKLVKLDDNDNW